MENAPGYPGGVAAEQAPVIPDIEPVTAHVTGPLGIDLGSVDVIARADEVVTAAGAERAAKEAVYREMGAGPVRVAGSLTEKIVGAGLAKIAAVKNEESAIGDMPEQALQATLEVNDSGMESPTTEAGQVELSPQEEVEQDADGQSVVSAESPRDEENDERTERIVQLSSDVGGVVLLRAEIETTATEEAGAVYAEQADNTASRAEIIGGLLVSATIREPEQADDSLVEDEEEFESSYLRQLTYGELQDRADEFAIGILGELAIASLAEVETAASDEDTTPEFSLTIEDLPLQSLAAHEQLQEPKTLFTLAA